MFWVWLTSLHYLQTFSWAKLSTLDMFSKVPRGQIKKVINFAFWSNIYWYGLALFLHDKGVLEKECSEKFFKIHRKTPVMKCLFNKIAGLRPAALLKSDSSKGVFPWILRDFVYDYLCNTI